MLPQNYRLMPNISLLEQEKYATLLENKKPTPFGLGSSHLI
jgi:hypothetical protein